MGFLLNQYCVIIPALLFPGGEERLFIDSHGGSRQVKAFRHTCAQGPFIYFFITCDVVRTDSGLLVCRAGEGDHGFITRSKLSHLNHISHRINVGDAGLQMAVDHNASPFVQRQACIGGKRAVRTYADGKNDHIRVYLPAARQQDFHLPVLLSEALNPILKQ